LFLWLLLSLLFVVVVAAATAWGQALVMVPPRRLRRGRRAFGAAAAVAAVTACAGLPWRLPLGRSFLSPAVASTASAALDRLPGADADSQLQDFAQILLAQQTQEKVGPAVSAFRGTAESALEKAGGADPFFYVYAVCCVLIAAFGVYITTKPIWEMRWLIEKINAQKLKFITQEEGVGPLEQYELGRMYNALLDFPSALAEFEEAEEDFDDIRPKLHPEDALGALASRAMLHNSKGFALMKLEPPRTAQARREFVRSVTYWPEYPEALLNIGRELIKRKRFDVAARTLTTAAKWQPGSKPIQEASDLARRGMAGQLEDAEAGVVQISAPSQ